MTDELVPFESDLIKKANALAGGAEIHAVAAFCSRYLNFHKNYSFWYTVKEEYPDDYQHCKTQAEFYERCLRSYQVTHDIYQSERLVFDAMVNEGKLKEN